MCSLLDEDYFGASFAGAAAGGAAGAGVRSTAGDATRAGGAGVVPPVIATGAAGADTLASAEIFNGVGAATLLLAFIASNGTIINATMLMILINGLTAGPAVSLYGSPTVSPVTAALCASEPLPP